MIQYIYMSKMSWPILHRNLLYEMGQDFLDIETLQLNENTYHTDEAGDMPLLVKRLNEIIFMFWIFANLIIIRFDFINILIIYETFCYLIAWVNVQYE